MKISRFAVAISIAATTLGISQAQAQVPVTPSYFSLSLPAKNEQAKNPTLLIACSSTPNDLSGTGATQYEMVLAFPDTKENAVKVRDNRGVNLAWVWLKFTDANLVPLWHPTNPRGISEYNKTANTNITGVNVLGLGNAKINMDRLMKSAKKNGFSVEWEPAKVGDKYPDRRTTEFDLSQLTTEAVIASYKKVCEGDTGSGGMFATQK